MKISRNTEFKLLSKKVLGFSMTKDIMPEFIREDGLSDEMIPKWNEIRDTKYFTIPGENDYFFDMHIDITTHKFSLVYDLGYPRRVDRILIGGFVQPFTDYSIGEFELYGSDDRETLFNSENKILYQDNRFNINENKPTNDSEYLYDVEGLRIRYFAFRHISSNSKDMFARVKNVCLYSDEFNAQNNFIYNNNLCGSLLVGTTPIIEGEFEGNPQFLTDNIITDSYSKVYIKSAKITVAADKLDTCKKLSFVGKNLNSIKINGNSIIPISQELYDDTLLYVTDDMDFSENSAVIEIDAPCELEQIMAFTDTYTVNINEDKVINNNFLGIGGNAMPNHLFESSRMNGFYEQHMELEKRRLAVMHPQVIRLWFQIDWFVMDEEDYYNRRYCFNSPKMRAFYKEMDAYKEADIEVELNFGWKVGYDIQSWFSFPDVFNRKNSAPKDINQYAIACADCLYELIVNRGYDNIKHLTFYNEANNSFTLGGGDFCVPQGVDVKEYWNEMLVRTNEELSKAGIRDKINIWAAETAGGICRFEPIEAWIDYLNKKSPDKYEYASYHIYRTSYEEAMYYADYAQKLAGDHPTCVTEYGEFFYGTNPGIDFDFERTNQSTVMGFMNGGVSAMMFWTLSGVHIDEHALFSGPYTNFWEFPTDSRGGFEGVCRRYYEHTLFTNYFPRHSKIVTAEFNQKDMHATAAITADGNYSIAIELNKVGFQNRKIDIKFPQDVNMKFQKHVYRLDTEIEPNAIIPPVCGEFQVKDRLVDTVDNEYNLVVYTTIPAKKQVALEEFVIYMKPGETKQLKAYAIDSDEKITWSLPDCHYNMGFKGTITPDGLYTADPRHPYGVSDANVKTDYAVKAELPSGEYAIGFIRVR